MVPPLNAIRHITGLMDSSLRWIVGSKVTRQWLQSLLKHGSVVGETRHVTLRLAFLFGVVSGCRWRTPAAVLSWAVQGRRTSGDAAGVARWALRRDIGRRRRVLPQPVALIFAESVHRSEFAQIVGTARRRSDGCASRAGSRLRRLGVHHVEDEWMTSSPPVPRIAAPRIASVSASTTIFMSPCVSPFSTARPTRVIGRLATRRLAPALARLCLRHPGPAERRIDVQRVGGDAIAHAARIVLEQVGGDDLAVVVRVCVNAPWPLQSPSAQIPGDARAQLVVDRDVAALVDRDARLLEAEIVGVGTAADGEQHVRAVHLRRAAAQSTLATISVAVLAKLMHFAFSCDLDALVLDDLPDRGRDVFVLAADEPRPHLDDRDLGAEAPEHLTELETDVAAADDDQMLGQEVHRIIELLVR